MSQRHIYIGLEGVVPVGVFVDTVDGVFGVELVRNVPGGRIGFHLLAGDDGYFWRIGDRTGALGQEHLRTAKLVLAAACDAVDKHGRRDGLPDGVAVFCPDDGAS